MKHIGQFAFILSLFPMAAEAAAETQFMAGVGQTWMMQKASDGQVFESYQPQAVRGGAQMGKWGFYLEYSRFRKETGGSHLNIRHTRNEMMVWSRYTVGRLVWRLRPYGALGVGAFLDQLKTDFHSDSARQTSQPEPQIGQALGVELTLVEQVRILLEGRLAEARTHQTNPLFGVGLTLEGRL